MHFFRFSTLAVLATPMLSIYVEALPNPHHPGTATDYLPNYPPLARRESHPLIVPVSRRDEQDSSTRTSSKRSQSRLLSDYSPLARRESQPLIVPVAQRGGQDSSTRISSKRSMSLSEREPIIQPVAQRGGQDSSTRTSSKRSQSLSEREPIIQPVARRGGKGGQGSSTKGSSKRSQSLLEREPIIQPVAQQGIQDDCTTTIKGKTCGKSKRELLQLMIRNDILLERAATDPDYLYERSDDFDYGYELGARDGLE